MDVLSDLWNGGGGHYTHKDKMYLSYIQKYFSGFEYKRVLEIGPGTGKFALSLLKSYDIQSYNILDISENASDSFGLLEKNGFSANVFLAEEFEKVLDEEFDFIVSNVCIPETPKEYRESVLNTLIPKAKGAMIIGQLSFTEENEGEYEDWIMNLFNSNFSDVKSKLTRYKNCYALMGKESLND